MRPQGSWKAVLGEQYPNGVQQWNNQPFGLHISTSCASAVEKLQQVVADLHDLGADSTNANRTLLLQVLQESLLGSLGCVLRDSARGNDKPCHDCASVLGMRKHRNNHVEDKCRRGSLLLGCRIDRHGNPGTVLFTVFRLWRVGCRARTLAECGCQSLQVSRRPGWAAAGARNTHLPLLNVFVLLPMAHSAVRKLHTERRQLCTPAENAPQKPIRAAS
mmetsp:Transcript_1151/g.3074  ORF Transcript_1151/g.3074 Transcript_1151/m.3074 type:complete len:218 (+) Transcript_1151:522-1175(+)